MARTGDPESCLACPAAVSRWRRRPDPGELLRAGAGLADHVARLAAGTAVHGQCADLDGLKPGEVRSGQGLGDGRHGHDGAALRCGAVSYTHLRAHETP